MTTPKIAILALVLTASGAWAEAGNPGAHFVENWDLNEDGAVSLEEATERRSDIFYTFDADENGVLDAEEHDQFDEARATDMKENGMGHGKGKGNPANGMKRDVTDANGDGQVSREEFMAAVPAWYAGIDRNGDGTVTVDDFGRN
ncbi:EF-hand domain-containing protein [Shimia sediminis]|uniref:EF-hand domain-containing protein n=1 Tax=Shimia sediminis TaxID=2497945 RepID=UPI000F8C431C|nr:EF-hand domain-containing protein [Shimia sediminis]